MREETPRVQAWDDLLNQDLMTCARLIELIVMNGRMFVGHSDSDKLSAICFEHLAVHGRVHLGERQK